MGFVFASLCVTSAIYFGAHGNLAASGLFLAAPLLGVVSTLITGRATADKQTPKDN